MLYLSLGRYCWHFVSRWWRRLRRVISRGVIMGKRYKQRDNRPVKSRSLTAHTQTKCLATMNSLISIWHIYTHYQSGLKINLAEAKGSCRDKSVAWYTPLQPHVWSLTADVTIMLYWSVWPDGYQHDALCRRNAICSSNYHMFIDNDTISFYVQGLVTRV
jgi:hypothetical protein